MASPWAVGDRGTDNDGVVWVLVKEFQARQTVGWWLNSSNRFSIGEWLESRNLMEDYSWPVDEYRRQEMPEMIAQGCFLLCREDEMDPEVNEFGPVSP